MLFPLIESYIPTGHGREMIVHYTEQGRGGIEVYNMWSDTSNAHEPHGPFSEQCNLLDIVTLKACKHWHNGVKQLLL